MSKKKKKVAKKSVVPYSLTQEQYNRLTQILNWDNPLHELGTIRDLSEPTITEVAFKAGEVYSKLEKMIEECSEIVGSVAPEEEDSYSDYNEIEEENN